MGPSSPSNDPRERALHKAAVLASGLLLLRGDARLQERIEGLAEATGAKASGISVFDDGTCWIPVSHGIAVESQAASVSLCAMVVDSNASVLLPDLIADLRLRDHPAVTGPMNVRAYVGVPINGFLGDAIGTVFICDVEERPDFDSTVLARLEEETRHIARATKLPHHRHRTGRYAIGPLTELIREAMRDGDHDLVTALDYVLRSIE